MNRLTTILTLACSSALSCSATWAQVNGTFNGHLAPQPAPNQEDFRAGPRAGERFKVNIWGQGEVNAIEILSAGGDRNCSRPFYIQGTMFFDASHRRATIDAEMLRCTDRALLGAPCNHPPYYKVRCTGTVLRNDDQSGYLIDLTYPDEKWLPEDCPNGKKRTDVGKERIFLAYSESLPAPPPDPGIADWFKKKIAEGEQHVRDVISGRAYDTSGIR